MSIACVDLTPGQIYRHQSNGSVYLCKDSNFGDAILLRPDGWLMVAHGVHVNADGAIWWNFSTSGRFTDERFNPDQGFEEEAK